MCLFDLKLILFSALVGFTLDSILGEPKRGHPLAFFGMLASLLERKLNRGAASRRLFVGAVAWCLLVLPLVIVVYWFSFSSVGMLIQAFVLYLAIANKSLTQHLKNIIQTFKCDNIVASRNEVAKIVSRDTSNLDKQQLIKASIESGLENSSDGIYGAVFWFLILGAPGALAYRLVNTLDAMWGYKNERFFYFGYASAKLDDIFNLIPARITACLFTLFAGNLINTALNGLKDARKFSSPNAGLVMATGAHALNLRLGGWASYHGVLINKPEFGGHNNVCIYDIQRTLNLIRKCNFFIIITVLLSLIGCHYSALSV